MLITGLPLILCLKWNQGEVQFVPTNLLIWFFCFAIARLYFLISIPPEGKLWQSINITIWDYLERWHIRMPCAPHANVIFPRATTFTYLLWSFMKLRCKSILHKLTERIALAEQAFLLSLLKASFFLTSDLLIWQLTIGTALHKYTITRNPLGGVLGQGQNALTHTLMWAV